jgi:glycosyltransferase involved in cell wall biosynthesis
LHICDYVHPYRMNRKTTGVGKHMINMALCLNQIPEVRVTLLASSEQVNADGSIQSDLAPIQALPLTVVPGKRWRTELTWSLFNRPYADDLVKGADWIYSSAEAYVPARSIPMAMTVHCVNWFERDLPWSNSKLTRKERFRMKLKWVPMLKKSRIIFTVSSFLKSRLVELFNLPEDKIVVVGNGVEQEYFDAGRSSDPIPIRDRPYIMIVGGLTARKGAPQVLQVAERLLRTNPDIELLIPGINEEQYVQQSRSLPNITLMGHETATTISQLMRGSIALMFLSRYETFGIPAVEAMAAGTPAIVSDYAALPEITGNAGLVVPHSDPDVAVDFIDQLQRDAALRKSQIEKGLAHVQQFTWDRCAQRAYDAFSG